MSYSRKRTTSAYEEKNVDDYVRSCVELKTTVSYHSADEAKSLCGHVLLVGTAAQLAEEGVKKLPFYDDAVAKCIANGREGKIVGTFAGDRRVTVGVVPETASRNNCKTRPDVITQLVSAALDDDKDVNQLDVFVRSAEELAVASAVAKGVPNSFSAKGHRAEKSYMNDAPTVRVFFPGTMKAKAESLSTVATFIDLNKRLVDAPTNLLDTTTFTEIAARYAEKLHCGIDIIAGEDLRERGYGGIYGVGKAAEFPPALVTLTYKPTSGMDPQEKIAMVGKGIVYDTGGLAIKTPATFMSGMKFDMGGAAAVFTGFLANVALGCKYELSVTLCLADNAIGPRSQRNDDIVRMKSGLTIEIGNTDAEGRLVLADGVYHASAELSFTPTTVVEMATLTGAQGITTGHKHAGIYCNSDDIEERAVKASRVCGDLVFPMVYAPEYHGPEFSSTCADYRNIMKAPSASSSCAGFFIEKNLAKSYNGQFLHVDMAYPVRDSNDVASGYGVSLLVQMYSQDKL